MPGTAEQAMQLAQQRWAAFNSFDLDPETWQDLFSQFRAGVILEAVKQMKGRLDPRPEVRYAYFVEMCERLQDHYTQRN